MRWTLSALTLVGLFACDRPTPEAKAARASDKPASLDAASPTAAEHRQGPAAMPETFAAFPRPDLAALDGVWIVDGRVWVFEDQGTKLTSIDRHGRETIHDVTLSSPCALRLTDDNGRAQTRSIALSDQRLIVTSTGVIAVAAPDGSVLACVDHRTFQIAADGRCRYTTELLGTWSDPADDENSCALETIDTIEGGRALTIAGQRLREHDGVWLDELAAASVATRMEDRAAAVAALTSETGAATSEAG